MELQIIPFDKKFKQGFVSMNVSWLEEFFYVEPHDRELLEDCENAILNTGGHIFFALQNDIPVGCYALIKIEEGIYELGKMAVLKKYRGHKIGHRLLEHCIEYARKQHWKELILYSNTSLKNAIHLYQKFGFLEIPVEANNPYSRGNIKMSLPFKPL